MASLDQQIFKPIIMSVEWTADLYRLVTISVRPGRVWSCTVGPRGCDSDQAVSAALELLAHIQP
jgi:hypothetical protein